MQTFRQTIFIAMLGLLSAACAAPPAPTPTIPSAIDSTATPVTISVGSTNSVGDSDSEPTATHTLEPQPTDLPTTVPPATDLPATRETITREIITIPLAVYILDDEEGELSSGRTVEEIEEIYVRVNEIWGQADIELELINVERVTVPQDLLIGINRRDFFSFFNAVNRGEIVLGQFAPIVGFYAQTLGGPNGINPSNSNAFFVMDTPSVHDERVTSHEIGHILGLHHVLDDPGRLLYSGTNGMALDEVEQIVARYSAEGLLARVR